MNKKYCRLNQPVYVGDLQVGYIQSQGVEFGVTDIKSRQIVAKLWISTNRDLQISNPVSRAAFAHQPRSQGFSELSREKALRTRLLRGCSSTLSSQYRREPCSFSLPCKWKYWVGGGVGTCKGWMK